MEVPSVTVTTRPQEKGNTQYGIEDVFDPRRVPSFMESTWVRGMLRRHIGHEYPSVTCNFHGMPETESWVISTQCHCSTPLLVQIQMGASGSIGFSSSTGRRPQ